MREASSAALKDPTDKDAIQAAPPSTSTRHKRANAAKAQAKNSGPAAILLSRMCL